MKGKWRQNKRGTRVGVLGSGDQVSEAEWKHHEQTEYLSSFLFENIWSFLRFLSLSYKGKASFQGGSCIPEFPTWSKNPGKLGGPWRERAAPHLWMQGQWLPKSGLGSAVSLSGQSQSVTPSPKEASGQPWSRAGSESAPDPF